MASEGGEDSHQEQGGLTHEDPPGGAVGGGPAAAAAAVKKTCNDGRFSALFPLCLISVPCQLASSPFVNRPVDLDHRRRVPAGWQRCLDLQTGTVFFQDLLSDLQEEGKGDEIMSRRGKAPKLDLRLNLSIHRGSTSAWEGGGNNHGIISPDGSSSSSSSPSSCLSSETDHKAGRRLPRSPEAASMVLVGCPRCLMYVMLSGNDPRCPKCKSTMLLDFLRDPNIAVNPPKKTRKLN